MNDSSELAAAAIALGGMRPWPHPTTAAPIADFAHFPEVPEPPKGGGVSYQQSDLSCREEETPLRGFGRLRAAPAHSWFSQGDAVGYPVIAEDGAEAPLDSWANAVTGSE